MKNNKLRIGLLIDDTLDSTDGVQQYVLTLGDWLSSKGHKVYYIAGETRRKDIKNIISITKNISVKFNKNKLSIPLPVRNKIVKDLIKELNLDVLHVQMPFSPFYAAKFIRHVDRQTKVVATFHIVPANIFFNFSSKVLGLLTFKAIKRIDSFISVSEAAKEFARRSFSVDSCVVPNAINTKRYRYAPKNKEPIRILFLGRLVERKGCYEFLKALNLIKGFNTPKYKVTIAGDGHLRPKLERYVIDKNLENISFKGYVSETYKKTLLSEADIAVFPSLGGESFGIVLIEAMACGSRVVIGGNNIGYRTVLDFDRDLLVDPKNTFVFSKKLLSFINNKQSRDKVSKALKSQVKKYDINNVGLKIESVYRD